MSVKVRIQDLQSKKVYKGSVKQGFQVGKTNTVLLTDGSLLEIGAVKGWVMSDSARLIYVIDGRGKRFKVEVV